MKKIYRRSQKKNVIGRCICGLEMHLFGLPYRNASGMISAKDEDLVDRMLSAADTHSSDIHVLTKLKSGWIANRYKPDGASCYYLATGNSDPEIEFSCEWLEEDWTQEELDTYAQEQENFQKNPMIKEQIAAVNFAMNAIGRKRA